ncbi:DUF2917 domain-containing protein [Paraburkholderia unamae]|uniref:DUF2917 family protein n=1 Tax=Paraburkholderia unamae TaxID=219649 RepID=A0ABX5KFU6_9BURK|nr:DUF2917 domain-containing protein [Paraburkholderia unamae]PVX77814.1 hypothetical protein C7402_11441 [Paraburkholderia unamae]CAG9256446.1 conserved hypothetical protein [Paraburkholderia unamae]
MREIRIFELEHGEPVETWRLAQAMQLHVSAGELWLTIAGDAGDYWLRAGESIDLMAGVRVHVSAGHEGARFMLALGGATAATSGAVAQPRAAGSYSFASRVGEALREWAQRAQWGARAAG